MRLDLHNKGDVRYREGFVIAHNPDNQPGKGSCIFAHLWRKPGEATAGCTAMPQENMQRLLDWLRPQARRASCCCRGRVPRLQAQWQLPALPGRDVERAGRTAAAARGQPLADRRPVDQRCDRQRHLPAAGRHRRPARPLQPVAVVAAGIVVALLVLCYAQAASYFDEPGGSYLYAREAFGRFAGFEIGWMIWLTRISSAAALSNALADAVARCGRGPAAGLGASR
jgi:hypothetical protein